MLDACTRTQDASGYKLRYASSLLWVENKQAVANVSRQITDDYKKWPEKKI
jgi:hypothetical protein